MHEEPHITTLKISMLLIYKDIGLKTVKLENIVISIHKHILNFTTLTSISNL